MKNFIFYMNINSVNISYIVHLKIYNYLATIERIKKGIYLSIFELFK